MKLLFTFISLVVITTISIAQVTVDNTSTPISQAIQNTLVGQGIVVSNIVVNGIVADSTHEQVGTFNDVGANTGLSSGIILGSGDVNLAAQLNTGGGTNLGGTGSTGIDSDLASISPNQIFDECVVEFDFIPYGDSIFINYVFASEEYEEYVCGTVNDAFGFFLSGNNPQGGTYNAKNIALVPNPLDPGNFTTSPVTINTINQGTAGSNGTLINCINMDPNFASYNIYYTPNINNTYEYDGKTVVLNANAHVVAGETYHFKLAIGDGGDNVFDSGVFIEAQSFKSNGISTSIENNDLTKNLTIFPNPSNGVFKYSLSNKRKMEGTISVTNIHGKEIYSKNIDSQNSTIIGEIDLSSLPKGIYLVSFSTQEDLFTKKIILK